MTDDTSEDTLMTIRQMCDLYDVTPRTLRFYETRGLLSPERRGQCRIYHHRDRVRMRLILSGKKFGFSLEKIRQLLELYDPSTQNRAQTTALLAAARERLAEMRHQKAELGIAIQELSAQIMTIENEQARLEPVSYAKTGTG